MHCVKMKGKGHRFGEAVTIKVGLEPSPWEGELNYKEIEQIIDVISNPLNHHLQKWILNSKKDIKKEVILNML